MGERKTILVVDDNQGFLDDFHVLLEISGYDAVKTISPDQARELMTKGNSSFNLVISDFEMPKEDEVDFLTFLHESEKAGKIKPHKRMLLSGCSFEHPKIYQAVQKNIVHRFVSKLDDPKAILNAISELLRG